MTTYLLLCCDGHVLIVDRTLEHRDKYCILACHELSGIILPAFLLEEI